MPLCLPLCSPLICLHLIEAFLSSLEDAVKWLLQNRHVYQFEIRDGISAQRLTQIFLHNLLEHITWRMHRLLSWISASSLSTSGDVTALLSSKSWWAELWFLGQMIWFFLTQKVLPLCKTTPDPNHHWTCVWSCILFSVLNSLDVL